jgi:phenylalanyl-tRNA synthetase beta chain
VLISYNWLVKYIETDLSAQRIAELLTSIGLEVEELTYYTTLPEGVENLIVGHVTEVSKHPNADTLKLTKVYTGGAELLNIVCGAPNVVQGQKVIVAKEGVKLHPVKGESFIIKKSKIRGELSEGMLCAEDEIGIGESHEGLLILPQDAEPGTSVIPYLKGYTDWMIEIGLTPNRVDAASHIGVARDLAALLGMKVKYPDMAVTLSQKHEKNIDIIIEDTEACPRYSGLVIKGVEVKESPEWIKDYLKVVGLNPINNIVDATNFVLHELGHPLHAFDLSQIRGKKIIIKKSEPGTRFTTLDKQERKLNGTELMICNADEPMAMAGIFGGLKSGITVETKDIFIESAYFDPATTRRSARRHQLFTDASFRFERGADPNITIKALGRIAKLILEIAGGEVIGPVYDVYPQPVNPVRLKFDYNYLDAVAGSEIPKQTVKNILSDLEFSILDDEETGLYIEVPTFKTDVKRPIDVVEEVIRIYSFDNIQMPKQIKSIVQVDRLEHSEKLKKRISAFLIDQGFYETYMLSFVKQEENRFFEERESIPVLNPISTELAEVRNNLLIPGLKAVLYNLNRQQSDIKFFNWDYIHQKMIGDYKQEYRLNLWLTGNNQHGNWHDKPQNIDFYIVKGIVTNILKLANRIEFEETSFSDAFFSAGITITGPNEKILGQYGRLQDKLLKQMDIDHEVFYVDLDAKTILRQHGIPLKYDPISRFPKVERDLAMIVPETLSYGDIRKLIEKTDNKILRKVSIFDVYKGKQVGEGLKSYAIRLEFEDKNQTLEDKMVDKVVQRIIYRLENELQVNIRS